MQLISNQYFIDILNTLTLNVIVDRNDAIINNGAEEVVNKSAEEVVNNGAEEVVNNGAEEVVNNGEGRSNHDMARSYFQEVQKKSL